MFTVPRRRHGVSLKFLPSPSPLPPTPPGDGAIYVVNVGFPGILRSFSAQAEYVSPCRGDLMKRRRGEGRVERRGAEHRHTVPPWLQEGIPP